MSAVGSAMNPPVQTSPDNQSPMYQFATVLGQAFAGHMQSSGDLAQIAVHEQRAQMHAEERLRAEQQTKAAADERERMLKSASDERERRDNQFFQAQSQAAVLASNIAMAAIHSSSGRVVASAPIAGPSQSATCTVQSTTACELIRWLVLNDILAVDSEWDTKALIDEGCTKGQDILMMDEKEWASVGFKSIAIRKLALLKKTAA